MAAGGETRVTNGLRTLTFAEAIKASSSLRKLSTGSEALDALLGGGFEEAKITEVFGPSNSGKTQLAIQATVMAATRGWRSVYVDTESTFRPERVEQIARARGIDAEAALASIYSVRAKDVQAQTAVLRKMAEDPRVSPAKLVVVDTVTKNFTLEYPGRDRMARRQGALGAYLNRVAIDAYSNRRVVLLANRVASVPRDGSSQDVDLGGITLRKFVSKSLRLRREGPDVLARVELPEAGRPVKCHLSERGFE